MSNEEGRSMDLWRGAISDIVEEDRSNEEGMGDLEQLRNLFFVYIIMSLRASSRVWSVP